MPWETVWILSRIWVQKGLYLKPGADSVYTFRNSFLLHPRLDRGKQSWRQKIISWCCYSSGWLATKQQQYGSEVFLNSYMLRICCFLGEIHPARSRSGLIETSHLIVPINPQLLHPSGMPQNTDYYTLMFGDLFWGWEGLEGNTEVTHAGKWTCIVAISYY